MRPKYKVTGCARFFLFLVIFIPVVFFGAAYFRGENGMQIIKDFYHQVIGGEKKSPTKAEDETKSGKGASDQNTPYEIDVLKSELQKAQEEIISLKAELKAKEKELEELKNEK